MSNCFGCVSATKSSMGSDFKTRTWLAPQRPRPSKRIFVIVSAAKSAEWRGIMVKRSAGTSEILIADEGALTQIKCYRGGTLDEGSGDSLTHIHGYPSHEH